MYLTKQLSISLCILFVGATASSQCISLIDQGDIKVCVLRDTFYHDFSVTTSNGQDIRKTREVMGFRVMISDEEANISTSEIELTNSERISSVIYSNVRIDGVLYPHIGIASKGPTNQTFVTLLKKVDGGWDKFFEEPLMIYGYDVHSFFTRKIEIEWYSPTCFEVHSYKGDDLNNVYETQCFKWRHDNIVKIQNCEDINKSLGPRIIVYDLDINE